MEDEEEEEDDLEAMMRKYREKEEKESRPTAFLFKSFSFLFFVLAAPQFLILERSLYLIPESFCRKIEAHYQQMNYIIHTAHIFQCCESGMFIPDPGSERFRIITDKHQRIEVF